MEKLSSMKPVPCAIKNGDCRSTAFCSLQADTEAVEGLPLPPPATCLFTCSRRKPPCEPPSPRLTLASELLCSRVPGSLLEVICVCASKVDQTVGVGGLEWRTSAVSSCPSQGLEAPAPRLPLCPSSCSGLGWPG